MSLVQGIIASASSKKHEKLAITDKQLMTGSSKPQRFTCHQDDEWHIKEFMPLADLKAAASGYLDDKKRYHFSLTVSAQVHKLQLLPSIARSWMATAAHSTRHLSASSVAHCRDFVVITLTLATPSSAHVAPHARHICFLCQSSLAALHCMPMQKGHLGCSSHTGCQIACICDRCQVMPP